MSVNHQGKSSHLLCSCSRVAPVKKVTFPRLELFGAVLLAEQNNKVLPMLKVEIHNVHLCTDSTVVLSWISSLAMRWNKFMANTVANIQETTNISDWKHVNTLENPADFISREVIQGTENLQLWWQAPQWLQQLATSWPSLREVAMIEDIPEERRKRSLVATTCAPTTE